MIRFIAPDIVSRFFDPSNDRNMLAAGLGIGILVIPIMASVSEDALRSVPDSLREASYGIGARKIHTVLRIVLPAAVSGSRRGVHHRRVPSDRRDDGGHDGRRLRRVRPVRRLASHRSRASP